MADTKPRARSYSEVEEEFFRSASTEAQPEPAETFADLDEGYRPRSLWRRLLSRKPTEG